MVRLVSAIALALALGIGPAAGAEDKVQESPYYPLKVGTAWVYRVGEMKTTMRVTRHEKVFGVMCALIETVREEKVVAREHVAAAADGIYRYAANGEKVDPPVRFLKLPPKKGDTWKVDSSVGGVRVKGTITAGEAEVTVPAGKYKTVTSGSQDCQIGDNKIAFTYYFASGVGMVRQTGEIAGLKILLELEKVEVPK